MYHSSFHAKKVPKINILFHLLACVFVLKNSGNVVLADIEGSKSKLSYLRLKNGSPLGSH